VDRKPVKKTIARPILPADLYAATSVATAGLAASESNLLFDVRLRPWIFDIAHGHFDCDGRIRHQGNWKRPQSALTSQAWSWVKW